MPNDAPSLIAKAAKKLLDLWEHLPDPFLADDVPENIRSAIARSMNSKTKSYRYVLPTQLLAKAIDRKLDCRSVQMQSMLERPFDARSLCHSVIVPFDQANHSVLGGSTEPYISNPLRIRAIIPDAKGALRDKPGFQDLIDVLDYAQTHPRKTEAMLCLALAVIRVRLGSVHVVYPAPKRLSLKQATTLVQNFLSDRTGGLRLQSVAIGLFQTVGRSFGLFAEVRSAKINAADASSGNVADLECVDEAGAVILAVEVKDRELRLHDMQAKLPAIRERGIGEVLFLSQTGPGPDERGEIENLIDRQFPSGHNVYVADFTPFLSACLILFGEKARREFVRLVGLALDDYGADISHRRKWAELLAAV